MRQAKTRMALTLFLFAGTAFPIRAYVTFNRCDRLKQFLKAVPNSMVLFYNGYTGNKKRMLQRMKESYYDVNIRFAVVDASNNQMRACADELSIFEYPSFAIFKRGELAKIVRGNPADDDLKYQVNKQLARDPENWSTLNCNNFHGCNAAYRDAQLMQMLPQQCSSSEYIPVEMPTQGLLPQGFNPQQGNLQGNSFQGNPLQGFNPQQGYGTQGLIPQRGNVYGPPQAGGMRGMAPMQQRAMPCNACGAGIQRGCVGCGQRPSCGCGG